MSFQDPSCIFLLSCLSQSTKGLNIDCGESWFKNKMSVLESIVKMKIQDQNAAYTETMLKHAFWFEWMHQKTILHQKTIWDLWAKPSIQEQNVILYCNEWAKKQTNSNLNDYVMKSRSDIYLSQRPVLSLPSIHSESPHAAQTCSTSHMASSPAYPLTVISVKHEGFNWLTTALGISVDPLLANEPNSTAATVDSP